MAVKELGVHFQFASWRVPQYPRAIEYPVEVMEEIRAFVCDELLQLSHSGDDVGGILFGTRREDLIRILTWRPIACDRTKGEGLQLSYNDRMNLAVQLEMARRTPDLKDLRPLGWFVSHLREDVLLTPSDLETYNGFFPEAWQVTLVICPRGGGLAQAGFFVREADDKPLAETSYQCFNLEPLNLATAAAAGASPQLEVRGKWAEPTGRIREQGVRAPEPSVRAPEPELRAPEPALRAPEQELRKPEPELRVAQPVPEVRASESAVRLPEPETVPPEPAIESPEYAETQAPVVAPEQTFAPQPGPPPDLVSHEAPRRTAATAWVPRELPPPDTPLPITFQTDDRLPPRERWLWAIPIVLALGIAAFMLYQRKAPSPGGSIGLRALNDAQTVQLAWDANSHAIRDSDHGEIEISDGGKNSQVSLTTDQLHAGKLSYLPQSSDIAFVMTVYPADGEPVHDSTRFIAPAFNAPTQPPQLLPEPTPPASAPAPASADHDALEQQVQQLRGDLSKERARAEELQNLVRILENRLGISSATARRR